MRHTFIPHIAITHLRRVRSSVRATWTIKHCAGVAIKVWMHQQRGNFATPYPYRPREGKNARWKLVERLRHARGNVAGRILNPCIHA